jgi:hypothetical protein
LPTAAAEAARVMTTCSDPPPNDQDGEVLDGRASGAPPWLVLDETSIQHGMNHNPWQGVPMVRLARCCPAVLMRGDRYAISSWMPLGGGGM